MSVHKTICSVIPDPEELLKLDLEDVAAVIMESLNSIEHLQLNRNDFAMRRTVQEYPPSYQERLLKALMTGWGYLEREVLIAEMPTKAGWFFITDKGKTIRSREDLNAYRASTMLPKYLLHPLIGKKVELAFQNAEYDTAVFQALREVEVAVRNAGRFSPTDIGAELMRKAFDPKTGPLRDDTARDIEQLAISEMFAGLIGAYKTPRSHLQVVLDAAEAAEIIIFASHLLKIVDERAAKMGKSSTVKEARTVLPRVATIQ
ncbi:MAG TPA: TIGR02391 family protein [Blastocatellia bacterium]|nr:TIGR02391 family protein [Blastocatellia bacterium]